MMDRNNATDITVLVDRSGSMKAIKADMEQGFAHFLQDQQQLPGKVVLSLYQFDTEFQSLYVEQPIRRAPPLTIQPRSHTALLDAMGFSIVETGQRLAAKSEAERPNRVIFVVITDGLENSSKEYERQQICEMVREQTEKYSWQFIYLGANQDAITVAENLGIDAGAALTYTPTTSVEAMRVMSRAVTDAASKLPTSHAKNKPLFSDKDRRKAMGSPPKSG